MQSIIWAQPLFARNKEIPSYLEDRGLAHGGASPSALVPYLVATAHPLLPNPPHPFSPHYVTRQHQKLQSSSPEQFHYRTLQAKDYMT
jgi:hypothetical protein